MTENKRFTYLNYSRDGYIGSFYLNDKPITNKEVWDLLNEQEERIKELQKRNDRQYKLLNEQKEDIVNLENRITQMQPFTVEAISVTHGLNGKYQSALTSIGAFDEFLRDLNETFGDFEHTTGKAVFDLIYERFRVYCGYELDKLNERCG